MGNFNNTLTVLEIVITKDNDYEKLNKLMENFTILEQVTAQQLK